MNIQSFAFWYDVKDYTNSKSSLFLYFNKKGKRITKISIEVYEYPHKFPTRSTT